LDKGGEVELNSKILPNMKKKLKNFFLREKYFFGKNIFLEKIIK